MDGGGKDHANLREIPAQRTTLERIIDKCDLLEPQRYESFPTRVYSVDGTFRVGNGKTLEIRRFKLSSKQERNMRRPVENRPPARARYTGLRRYPVPRDGEEQIYFFTREEQLVVTDDGPMTEVIVPPPYKLVHQGEDGPMRLYIRTEEPLTGENKAQDPYARIMLGSLSRKHEEEKWELATEEQALALLVMIQPLNRGERLPHTPAIKTDRAGGQFSAQLTEREKREQQKIRMELSSEVERIFTVVSSVTADTQQTHIPERSLLKLVLGDKVITLNKSSNTSVYVEVAPLEPDEPREEYQIGDRDGIAVMYQLHIPDIARENLLNLDFETYYASQTRASEKQTTFLAEQLRALSDDIVREQLKERHEIRALAAHLTDQGEEEIFETEFSVQKIKTAAVQGDDESRYVVKQCHIQDKQPDLSTDSESEPFYDIYKAPKDGEEESTFIVSMYPSEPLLVSTPGKPNRPATAEERRECLQILQRIQSKISE